MIFHWQPPNVHIFGNDPPLVFSIPDLDYLVDNIAPNIGRYWYIFSVAISIYTQPNNLPTAY